MNSVYKLDNGAKDYPSRVFGLKWVEYFLFIIINLIYLGLFGKKASKGPNAAHYREIKTALSSTI